MRRATFTGPIVVVAVALTSCGTSGTPAAGGGPAGTSTARAAAGGQPAASSTSAAPSSNTERPPTCYPAILTENSGTGPTYHVRICDALRKPRPGQEWQLIVDGGPLRGQAVIFGQQVPRQPSPPG